MRPQDTSGILDGVPNLLFMLLGSRTHFPFELTFLQKEVQRPHDWFLGEKENSLKTDDHGRDLSSVQTLLTKQVGGGIRLLYRQKTQPRLGFSSKHSHAAGRPSSSLLFPWVPSSVLDLRGSQRKGNQNR